MKTKPGRKPAKPAKRTRAPKVDAETRRQAILDAALSVFAEHGFEAARLDEVAARAGVAKGTLYLYFRHKEALFEELVRSAVAPVIEAHRQGSPPTPPCRPLRCSMPSSPCSRRRCWARNRKLLLRLIIAEGPRFPAIAEFYYREVVSRGLEADARRGRAGRRQRRVRHATRPRAIPQLIVAPLLVAVLWDGMFCEDRSARRRRTAACAPRAAAAPSPTGAGHEHAATGAPFCWRCRGRRSPASPPTPFCIAARRRLQFQGWVEAEMLFVSPDEVGRVETLSVREGDDVAAGAPLFALDADLQRAAVAENEAAVANAAHHLPSAPRSC